MTPYSEFTELEVEAAQNLWEAFIAYESDCDSECLEDPTGLVDLRRSMGSVHVRWLLRQKHILSAVVRAWEAAPEDVREKFVPYDWKFCPWFLENCLHVNAGYLFVMTNEDIKRKMLEEKD